MIKFTINQIKNIKMKPFLTKPETHIEWALLFIAVICIIGVSVTIIGFTFFKLQL